MFSIRTPLVQLHPTCFLPLTAQSKQQPTSMVLWRKTIPSHFVRQCFPPDILTRWARGGRCHLRAEVGQSPQASERLWARQASMGGLHMEWEGALAASLPSLQSMVLAVGSSVQSAISPGMPCGKAGCISILGSGVKSE